MLIGRLAQKRGVENAGRLVSSAKSWLSHAGVDRTAAILPWTATEGVKKLSPVEASRRYLQHLRDAWDFKMPGAPFADQQVLVTVPASFDAVARELTQSAAEQAGYQNITLLEEPQAAFLRLDRAPPDWRERVRAGDLILVVDIGGGTTDFTLIAVTEREGELALDRSGRRRAHPARRRQYGPGAGPLHRTGVGGKGNQARWLAASRAMAQLPRRQGKAARSNQQSQRGARHHPREGHGTRGRNDQSQITPLPPWRWCCATAFSPSSRATICRSASAASACRRSACPTPPTPPSPSTWPASSGSRLLPPSMAAVRRGPSGLAAPTHVLFNGGVFNAGLLRDRVVATLNAWLKEEKMPAVQPLSGEDLMHAVARGAAYYGLARHGKGVRIRGGVPRTYYVGIESAMPAVPGIPNPVKALTVAPFGMEEGTEAVIPHGEFGLVVGEPAEFRFFGSATRKNDPIGSLIEDTRQDLEELSPMEVNLPATEGFGQLVPVSLETVVTETGILQLWCVARDGRRWKLEFNVRERVTA